MSEAGLQCIHDMSSRSVMWLHTLGKIPELWNILLDCTRSFDRERPKLVILIDYAGFNFYLAKAAKKRNIPVMYYVSPQLWAHGAWRSKKLRKLVDKMAVIYPFEETFYTNEGLPVKYVGHPLYDEINGRIVDENFVSKLKEENKLIVSLLPGSRTQEIKRLLPILLKTAHIIHQKVPSTKFIVSCSNMKNHGLIDFLTNKFIQTKSNTHFPIEIITEKISELIKASSLCVSSSGTITLEIASYSVPMVICYRISPFSFFVAKPFLNTPYICLVNKIAERTVVPEKLMYKDEQKWLASKGTELLLNEEKRRSCIEGLKEVNSKIGTPGASEKAANEVLNMIDI